MLWANICFLHFFSQNLLRSMHILLVVNLHPCVDTRLINKINCLVRKLTIYMQQRNPPILSNFVDTLFKRIIRP